MVTGSEPGVVGVGEDDAARFPGALAVVRVADRLADLVSQLASCPVTDLAEPDASRVHAVLRRVVDTVGIVQATVPARVEADGRWATTPAGRGARDLEGWLTTQSGCSRAGARRQTRLARTLQDESVPGLADAVTAGGVSLEHADVLTRLGPTTPAPDPSNRHSEQPRRGTPPPTDAGNDPPRDETSGPPRRTGDGDDHDADTLFDVA